MTERSDKNTAIETLLHRLNSADAGPAWSEFIDRFAPLIMRAVNQFECSDNRSGDCFLYVCEKLVERGFRRLLRFNTAGTARFSTWLGAVVFNLCVDWHRNEYGRVQLLPAISALPVFDQAVYQLCFERYQTGDSCFETLRADFPDLTREQLADAMARVQRALTPRQRWQINVRMQRRKQSSTSLQTNLDRLRHDTPGPDEQLQRERDQAALKTAMSALEADQRLLLHLRFHHGLTLARIAEIMRLGDPFRARRQLQTALDRLSATLNDQHDVAKK